MNDQRDDQDLRAAFETLRRETQAGVAPFRRPRRAPARRTIAWHLKPLLATGVLAAVIAGLVIERRAVERRRIVEPFLTSTAWESPTDFLLATPGQELLNTVPAVGTRLTDTTGGVPQ